jgi:hypothetical protein
MTLPATSVVGRALPGQAFVLISLVQLQPRRPARLFFVGLVCAGVTSDHSAGLKLNKSPEAMWAELCKLSAETSAGDSACKPDRGVRPGSPRQPGLHSSVLEDAANTTRSASSESASSADAG